MAFPAMASTLTLDALADGGVSRCWLSCLSSVDLLELLPVCHSFKVVADCSSVWREAARLWGYDGDASWQEHWPRGQCESSSSDKQPWRAVCALHERLWKDWRGGPASLRLNLREELRRQRIADLEVLLVQFLAGDEAFALGHSNGAVSLWRLRSCIVDQDGMSPPPPRAEVLGVFHTSRSHDVQDLSVWPSPVARPGALKFGGSVWLAAAVGPTVYVWESARGNRSCAAVASGAGGKRSAACGGKDPPDALAEWSHRGALRHARFVADARHVVWSVRIGNCDQADSCRAVTISEDFILRAWRFGAGRGDVGSHGLDGVMLWQCEAGDARQAVAMILPAPPVPKPADFLQYSEPFGRGQGMVALARADQRSLQLLELETGVVVETVDNVWPSAAGSLPQAAAYDACGMAALFSSILESGDGTLAWVHLAALQAPTAPRLSNARQHCSSLPAGCGSSTSTGTAPLSHASRRVSRVVGPLAGTGRVLRMALFVPAADILLAMVQDGSPTDVLEVWERRVAFGGHPQVGGGGEGDDGEASSRVGNGGAGGATAAHFRGRVPPFLGNPRLMAVGGRRVALLDPVAFLSTGELRILEWRAAGRRNAQQCPTKARRLSSFDCSLRAGVAGPRSTTATCGSCLAGFRSLRHNGILRTARAPTTPGAYSSAEAVAAATAHQQSQVAAAAPASCASHCLLVVASVFKGLYRRYPGTTRD